MPVTLDDILYGFAAPAIFSGVVMYVLGKALPNQFATRFSAAIGNLLGFLSGYALLSLAPWSPTAHWHWIPYGLLLAAFMGPVTLAKGITKLERWLLYLLTAGIAAWLLVPTWPDLQPDRVTYIAAIVAYIVLLTVLLEPLCERFSGPFLPAIFSLVLAAAAAVLVLSGNLKFGQVAGLAMAGMAGCTATSFFLSGDKSIRGATLFYSVTVVALLLVGQVNSYSNVPLASYSLVPAAPLLLWICVRGPLSRLTGAARVTCNLFVVLAPLIIALALAVLADLSGP